MKTRILSAAMMAMASVVSCTEDISSPQQPAGPAFQESAVIVHAVMDEGMTKVTLGDDSGASTQVHWDAEDKIGITIDETTYTFDKTDDAVESKTADFEYKAGEPELPTLTAGEYTFTYPATGNAALTIQTGTNYYNDRWPDSDSPKSMNDPCPAGWRVPDGGENGIWAKAHGSSATYTHANDSNKKGHNFSGDFGESSPIWYPVMRRRSYDTGNLSNDNIGSYWSGSPKDNMVYYLYTSGSNVNPASYAFRAFGQAVRRGLILYSVSRRNGSVPSGCFSKARNLAYLRF